MSTSSSWVGIAENGCCPWLFWWEAARPSASGCRALRGSCHAPADGTSEAAPRSVDVVSLIVDKSLGGGIS